MGLLLVVVGINLDLLVWSSVSGLEVEALLLLVLSGDSCRIGGCWSFTVVRTGCVGRGGNLAGMEAMMVILGSAEEELVKIGSLKSGKMSRAILKTTLCSVAR